MILPEQREKLLENGRVNMAHRMEDGRTVDFFPVVKLFNPCGAATWWLSELDEDGDTAFGVCDLGMGFAELGYSSLAEIAAVTLPFGLYIERDEHFEARFPVTAFAAQTPPQL
jgi:hypothetical protein